ncbi:MAG TPA: hypothetical protein VJX94_10705 [Stellaceae bacterium]|nr:hypothetical protein [Stellaceae bacterium]
MPSNAVDTFTDPDDYVASVRGMPVEVTVTGHGRFTAKSVSIDLHGLWIMRFSDNLPRIVHAAPTTGRGFVSFRTQPGPSLIAGGLEMLPSHIIWRGRDQSFFQQSSGFASSGSMSLPEEEMVSVGATIVGHDLTAPDDSRIFTPLASAMARLRRLHAAAGRLAEDAPEM